MVPSDLDRSARSVKESDPVFFRVSEGACECPWYHDLLQSSDVRDFVANIKSQIKRNRQNAVRHARNKAVRSEVKTRSKRAIADAVDGAPDLPATLESAVRRIDKAAAQGIIHKNQAARRKSRLMRTVNRATRPATS